MRAPGLLGPEALERAGRAEASAGGAWLRSLLPILVGIPAILLVAQALPGKGDSYVVYVAGLAGINVVLAVSLNVVNGFTGQFSLGHAGLMAVGGYAAAALTTSLSRYEIAGLPVWLFDQLLFAGATVAGGLLAAVAGLVVGFPSLRLRGDYLAIVTLGFGEIIRVLIENFPAVGGATGMTGIPPLTSIGWILFWAFAVVLVSVRLASSTHGRALLAIREDEIAAEAMGVDTTGYKVRAFAFSAFFAGVAGSLLGHYLQILTPRDFTFLRSIEIVAMVVLGGTGSVSGAVLAAILLTVLPEALRPVQDLTGVDFRMAIYAGLLVLLMLLRPQGLFGSGEILGPARMRLGLAFGRRGGER